MEVSTVGGEYVITAVCTVDPDACPKCGTIGQLYKHGTQEVAFRDTPMHGKRVTISVQRRRYRCRSCKATFVQPLAGVAADRMMTARCADFVRQQALARPFTHIAAEIGLDEKTVRQLAAERIAEKQAEHRIVAPRILGIDDVHLRGVPRAIFTDIEARRVLDLLAARKATEVRMWLHKLKEKERVKAVAIDMWKPFRDASRAILPEATVVIDKFHVLAPLHRGLDAVRKQVGKTKKAEGRRALMHDRFLLLSRPEKLTPDRALLLDGLLKNEPVLKVAYDAKEDFMRLYDAPSKQAAEEALDRWRSALPNDLHAAFGELLSMTAHWRTEILAFWDWPITNGFTEAANGVMKVVNRLGRGYTFEVIRARVLFGRDKPEAPSVLFIHGAHDDSGDPEGAPPLETAERAQDHRIITTNYDLYIDAALGDSGDSTPKSE